MRLMDQFDVAISSNKAQCNEAKSIFHFSCAKMSQQMFFSLFHGLCLWQVGVLCQQESSSGRRLKVHPTQNLLCGRSGRTIVIV